MKKIILTLAFSLVGLIATAQWQPHNPTGLIYRDTIQHRTIILTPDWLDIQGQIVEDVILYDSVGHPIREWKRLDLRERDESIAYRIIYRFITNEVGWVRFGKVDIPTIHKDGYFYDYE